MRTHIPKNVEGDWGGGTASTSFNIHDKRNIEWSLKQRSLKAFKLLHHRFNFDSTRMKGGGGGGQTVSASLFNKINRMLKQMLKLFSRALS